MNLIPFDSKIASSVDLPKLKEWIGYDCELDLLYRGTRDGKESKTFHKKCDGKGPTISIIHSEDGSKFGGYTDLDWEGNDVFKKGNGNSFLFSFNKQKKYSCTDKDHEIYCHPSYSLYFGGGPDFVIHDNWSEAYSRFPFSYGLNENADENEIVDYIFKTIEVEVFSVRRK